MQWLHVHISVDQNAEGEIHCGAQFTSSFPLFIPPKFPAHGLVPSVFRMSHTPQLISKLPHRHTQRCASISYETPNPVELTIKLNHHAANVALFGNRALSEAQVKMRSLL